jgi:hypothetical protein
MCGRYCSTRPSAALIRAVAPTLGSNCVCLTMNLQLTRSEPVPMASVMSALVANEPPQLV